MKRTHTEANERASGLLARYRETGRLAFLHPRKGTVSLDGGRSMPIAEACAKMLACLNRPDVLPVDSESRGKI